MSGELLNVDQSKAVDKLKQLFRASGVQNDIPELFEETRDETEKISGI